MVCLAYKTVDQSCTCDTEKNKNSDLKWERAQVIIRVYWPTAVCKYMCICAWRMQNHISGDREYNGKIVE